MNRLTMFYDHTSGKLNIYPRQVKAQPLYLKQYQIIFDDPDNALAATAIVLNLDSVLSGSQFSIAFDNRFTNADQTSLSLPISYSQITNNIVDQTVLISSDINASNNNYKITSLTGDNTGFISCLLIFEYEFET